MNDITITLVQSSLFWENIDSNLNQFSKKLEHIDQTDLIILPEMFNTGFSMNAQDLAEVMNVKTMIWMKEMANKYKCVITGSIIIKEKDSYYNRLIWMRADGSYETYDKRHLFGLGEEDKTYTAGKERLIVDLNGWNICPMICYDLRFPVWSRNIKQGDDAEYDLLIYTANWPQRRIHHWNALLPARAVENQCYVVGLNRVGNDGNDIPHSGDSQVIDPNGTRLYYLSEEKEGIHTLTLSAFELKQYRRAFPFLKDADRFSL